MADRGNDVPPDIGFVSAPGCQLSPGSDNLREPLVQEGTNRDGVIAEHPGLIKGRLSVPQRLCDFPPCSAVDRLSNPAAILPPNLDPCFPSSVRTLVNESVASSPSWHELVALPIREDQCRWALWTERSRSTNSWRAETGMRRLPPIRIEDTSSLLSKS